MRTVAKSLFILLFITFSFPLRAQSIDRQLSQIPDISLKQIPNDNFKEYYEIFIQQPLDHENPLSEKFQQRLFLGFISEDLPTIISTDGYGTDYASKSSYQNELAPLLDANLIIIEHRYFGRSIPDTMNYNYLTVKQTAADAHTVRNIFASILKNKWISSGISKGGQAALAYKLFYPNDVSATVVYGTAIKSALTENKIDSMLAVFEKTQCGNKLELIKLYAFKNKQEFIPLLKNHIVQNKLVMKQFDPETYFDYLLLELPFSFLQNGNNCKEIPPAEAGAKKIFNFLISVVHPRFFDSNNMERFKPAFYMFYHELGYYEYDTEKYKSYLHQIDYSNRNFAPQNIKFNFDKTYLGELNKFLKTKESENIIFIYGERDPWSAMQNTGMSRKEIIKNGSHKSRISDMGETQRERLLKHLNTLLDK